MIRVVDDSDGFIRDLIAATDAGLRAASHEGADGAAASMPGAGATKGTGPKGGRVYTPSFPGKPPGVRLTGLKGSLANARLRPLVWGYGTNLDYGRHLERGTRRMAARPFLKPTLVTERVNMERAFTRTASRHMARSITARVA